MSEINAYQVDVILRPRVGRPTLQSRVEYAYGVTEAVVQAMHNARAAVGHPNGLVVLLHHVGPLRERVLLAAGEELDRVLDAALPPEVAAPPAPCAVAPGPSGHLPAWPDGPPPQKPDSPELAQ